MQRRRSSQSALNQHTHTSASLLLWHATTLGTPLIRDPGILWAAKLSVHGVPPTRKSTLLLYNLRMEKTHVHNDDPGVLHNLLVMLKDQIVWSKPGYSSESPGKLGKIFFLRALPSDFGLVGLFWYLRIYIFSKHPRDYRHLGTTALSDIWCSFSVSCSL